MLQHCMLLPVFRFLFAIQMIDEIKAKHKRPTGGTGAATAGG
jgi:hypothetical protein